MSRENETGNWTSEDELNFQMGDMNGEVSDSMTTENKPEVCQLCPGVVCVDVEADRVAISLTKPEAIVVFDNVRDCAIKNDEVGTPKQLFTKDILWDLTTELTGIKKHMAFIKRVEGK